MKLKNKKTGEIGRLAIYIQSDEKEKIQIIKIPCGEGSVLAEYESLAELNKEWEDYEDRLDHYYILHDGDIVRMSELISSDLRKDNIEIGNYFETKEEAERAVEKLKAWKRLRDNGFKFIGKTYETDKRFGSIFYKVDEDTYSEDIVDELDLLFGGEDE